MKYSIILSLVAALPSAYAVAFGGPVPTDTSPNRVLEGMAPEPTNGPSINELRKRQSSASPEICGWVDGILGSAVSCTIGSCMLYKSATLGMAGCCTGSDRQNCGWAKACIDLTGVAAGSCGSNCISNSLTRKCTNIAAPYCVTWTYPGEGVADYGCDSTSTNGIETILLTASRTGRSSSIRLPTVSAAAVVAGDISSRIASASSIRIASVSSIRFDIASSIRFDIASSSSSRYGSGSGSGSGSGTTYTYDYDTPTRRLAIGTIIGIVVAVLGLLFFIGIGACMCIKRKKKAKLIANNANIVAAQQGNGPNSQFQPQMQQQGPPPPMGSPPPANNGYFAPPAQEQKYNPQPNVQEYAMTPLSNPATPAPQYSQLYGTPAPQQQQQYPYVANGAHEVAAPVPQQQALSPVQQQYQYPANGAHEVGAPVPQQQSVSPLPQQQSMSPVQQSRAPEAGAHEVDAMSVPHAPGKTGPVYEIGGR